MVYFKNGLILIRSTQFTGLVDTFTLSHEWMGLILEEAAAPSTGVLGRAIRYQAEQLKGLLLIHVCTAQSHYGLAAHLLQGCGLCRRRGTLGPLKLCLYPGALSGKGTRAWNPKPFFFSVWENLSSPLSPPLLSLSASQLPCRSLPS